MTIVDSSTRNGSPLRSEAPEPGLLAQRRITHTGAAPGPSRAGQDALESSDHPGPRRKSRRGSENRRLSAQFTVRMTEQARAKLDEAAREQGFKDAKALVMYRLRDDLGGLELVS